VNEHLAFVISLIDDHITIVEYQKSIQQSIKRNGEESWPYQVDFWDWFRQKISYNHESISFIVITDREGFTIPEDTFNLAQINTLKGCHIQKDDTHRLLTFPALDVDDEKKLHTQISGERVCAPSAIKEHSLQRYFIQKTQRYHDE